jgi:hypothetical protein
VPNFADTRVSLAGQGMTTAIAAGASASGAVAAYVGGTQITVRVMTGLTVAAGNTLLISRQGSTYWAIGVYPAAPAVPPSAGSGEPPANVDAPPPPKPTTTRGTLTCSPVSTATYRDGSWRTDIGAVDSADTYQGRYSGSGFGQNTGCAFYGSKPHTLSGAVCTGISIHARRLSSGDFSARAATLWLVTQKTRPGGAPALGSSTTGPSLAVNSTTLSAGLPNAFGQALIDGTAGGLAMTVASDSPYIRWAGRGSWSGAWVIVISWQRG